MRIGVLLFCGCTTLFAQTAAPPDPSTLARVEGRLTNAVTGEPVRKATVNLTGTASYNATSDAAGHFAIEKIAPGSYGITVQHQSFSSQSYGSTKPGRPGTRFTLAAGQSMTGADLKLTPLSVISGKVLDEDGDPVSGIQVTVMRWAFLRGGRQLTPSGSSISNDRGEFRAYNLVAGRYLLVARAPMRGQLLRRENEAEKVPANAPPKEVLATTYYPSTTDLKAAAYVQIAPGQEAPGMDIQLRKTRVFNIRGRIGGKLSGRRHSISLTVPNEPASTLGNGRGAIVRDDGTFAISEVTPGEYLLTLNGDDGVAARVEVTVGDGDIDGLVVPIVDFATLKGTVRYDGARPTQAAGRIERLFLGPATDTGATTPAATVRPDGTFEMAQIAPDRYQVRLPLIAGSYVKSMLWNGQPVTQGFVDINGGSGTLDIRLAPTKAQIEGDVKTSSGDAAPGARVLLIPATRRESDFRLLAADPTGHFVAQSMAPGSYIAIAVDTDLYGMPDSGLTKALERYSTSISLDVDGKATTTLALIPDSVLDGLL